MLLRTNILFENSKEPAIPISKVTDTKTVPSSLENKSLQSISSSSSISERHKSNAQMRRSGAKKANKDTSSTLQHKNQKNYSKSQKQPSNKSIYSKALSLISKTIAPTKSKSVQVSINTLPTSVLPSTPPNKFKKTVETTHLFEQFYHKRTYNYRKAYPSVSCITDVTAFAVYDKGYNAASRIERMVKDVYTESSNSKVITKDGHPNKTTRQPNNNAGYPGITDELVLDSKVNHEFQVNSAPCSSSTASSSSTAITTTATASLSVNKNSVPSNKLDSRPKIKKDNTNDGTTSPSEATTTHYISFNFYNPKLNSSASQHVLKEKRKVTPSVPVKIQESESYNEEEDEEDEEDKDEDKEENDDCDNNSIYSYFEMIQMLQENPDYYNLEEEGVVVIEEEEYGQEEEVEEEEEKKKIKEYETPEPVTLESALSELKTGRLNILGTLAKANKKNTKLMNNIYNDKKRIVTVGFKFEDITKEEEEGNISSERAEKLKLKKEEYQKRMEKYQKNQDEMKTQAIIQLTKTIGNMVTLVSTERALVSMEREFFNAKKKSGIFKKIKSLFSFGRKD